MINFSDFLTEAIRNNMRGRISGAEAGKTLSALKTHVLPFLDQKEALKASKILSPYMEIDASEDGESSGDKETHTFESSHGKIEKGTPTKIIGIHHIDPDGTVFIKTDKHGIVPMSKLSRSKYSREANKAGFEVEDRINNHWGTKSAGSTSGHDFSLGDSVRGESKLTRGKMGQGVLSFSKGKWTISHPDPRVAEFMSRTMVGKRRILDHMNAEYPDGVITKGFTASAPTGMTREYLRSKGTNVLHIHDKKDDVGTSFTFGSKNDLAGKTRLGHLSDEDLDSLDGSIEVEKTFGKGGSSTIIHRPKRGVMRSYSQLSRIDPENHRDLSQESHALEFKDAVSKNTPPSKSRKPPLMFGGSEI